MICVSALILSYAVSGCWCVERLVFPPGFMFGAATAAAQVEGAWNISKSESIWDRLAHSHPDKIAGGANADVACDSYHLWRQDIEMVEELGLNMYRFSISWCRILPTGFPNYINKEGVKYYSDLIDGLLEKGAQPLVTLYHYDLPQSLQDLGGWANPLVTDWFGDYARVVYSLYADRVKFWLTINEPLGVCDSGYSRQHAPFLDDKKIGQYLCNKYLLMAHAKAWRIYDEEFKPKYHGKMAPASLFTWFEPKTPEDVEATDIAIAYWEGRYSYPIYSKNGGWMPRIEKILAEKSKKEGYPQPRLPPFTPEEIEFVKGTYDFYALNHYVSRLIRKAKPGEKVGYWPFTGAEEIGVVLENPPEWEGSELDWFKVYPEGLRHQLHWMNASYSGVDIMITENGFPSLDPSFNDRSRLEYLKSILEQLLLAISDGIPVIGYNVWSLMDNFEWLGGYTVCFGLYAVNFTSPLRTRTARDSARYYASVTRTRSLHPTLDGLNYT